MNGMKKIIIANWKMAPNRIAEAKKIFGRIKKTASGLRHVQTVVCPPSLYLGDAGRMVTGHRCVVGAQDVSAHTDPAHTGEVSSRMLANAGARYAIVGHSERRAAGESSELVNKKLKAALGQGLVPVLCVGETERDPHGAYAHVIISQLTESLAGVRKSQIGNVVIAYEPVWAIGKNAKRAASVSDCLEISLLVKKTLVDAYGKDAPEKVAILYGGSVTPENARGFLTEGGVDGLLVGRASLDSEAFGRILKTAHEVGNAKKK